MSDWPNGLRVDDGHGVLQIRRVARQFEVVEAPDRITVTLELLLAADREMMTWEHGRLVVDPNGDEPIYYCWVGEDRDRCVLRFEKIG